MNKEIENFAFRILDNKIYGNQLVEEWNSFGIEDVFESQSLGFLKQLMESRYYAINSKNEETATSRMQFATDVYNDRILVNNKYYSQEVIDKVKEVLDDTQEKFSEREFTTKHSKHHNNKPRPTQLHNKRSNRVNSVDDQYNRGMINKIKKLNFRIFKDFEGRALEFKKDNLIFGWNYSGKTTLSDFFQILEKGEVDDGEKLDFNIELDDDTQVTKVTQNNSNIRVFNKKFVERELGVFDEVNAMEIALGEDKGDVEQLKSISDKMEQEEASLKKIVDKIIDNKRINNEIIKSVEKIKTDKAKNVKDRCGEMGFNKNKLEKFIVRDSETLSEDNLKVEYAKINQQMLRDIAEFDASNISISEDKMQKIFAILERKITLQETITEIDGKSDRKEWVRRGMELHQNIKDCLFCGNDISPERLEKLSRYFSSEYTKVKNEVDQHLTYVADLIQKIENFKFPTKNDFLSANQDVFSSINIVEMKGKYQKIYRSN